MQIRPTRLRKLARDHGDISFNFTHSYNAEKLDLLIQQKTAQYFRTQVSNPLGTATAQGFLHALAQLPTDKACSPAFSTLHCGQTLIAAHFGLTCGDTLHYWFPVHDPAFNTFSPGRILMWEMIRHASEIGLRNMDFGEGDSPAKRNFANRDHTYFRGFYTRPTPQGFTDRALMAVQWRLQQLRKKPEAAPTAETTEAPNES